MSVRTPPDSYTRARSGRTLPAFLLDGYEAALFETQARILELERQIEVARLPAMYDRHGIMLEAELSERISDTKQRLERLLALLRDERP